MSEFLADVSGNLLVDLIKLIVTFALTFPIAYNRERATRIMGLRTYPLVSITVCALLLAAQSTFADGSDSAQARVVQGILTGIGFIGGGAILKRGNRVMGTASAASIWTSGALGITVAYGRYDLALVLSLVTLGILRWLTPLKEMISENDEAQSSERQANRLSSSS